MNFKYLMMASALVLGFASCSKDSDNPAIKGGNEPEETTEFVIKTSVVGSDSPMPGATRATSTTAVGIPPHVLDMALIFVGKKNATQPLTILEVHKGDPAALTGAGQKFKSMPIGVTDLYIVGNIENYPTAGTTDAITDAPTGTLPADFGKLEAKAGSTYANSNAATEWEKLKEYEGKTFDQLQAEVKFSLDRYDIKDVKAVNIYGHGSVTATQGTTALELFVRPAISRYEIGEIKTKEGSTLQADGSTLTMNEIEVDGIYISNTMREISFDGTVYGDDPAKLLNWGWNTREWNYSLKGMTKTDTDNPRNDAWYSASVFPGLTDTEFGDAAKNYFAAGEWSNWMDKGVLTNIAPITGSEYYSYYVATARQQATKQIVNPYDENEAHNFIGLECGQWPYDDEAAASGVERPNWATKGAAIQYGAFPTINIKVRLKDDTKKFKNTGSNVGWLTVTKFIDSVTKEYLKHPLEGRVYVFKSIVFDEENVKPDPMYPGDETDLSVHVVIKGWEGVYVDGEDIFN